MQVVVWGGVVNSTYNAHDWGDYTKTNLKPTHTKDKHAHSHKLKLIQQQNHVRFIAASPVHAYVNMLEGLLGTKRTLCIKELNKRELVKCP